MDILLSQISQSLQHAKSEEELVRPLLAMVLQVTKLESAYLTQLDATTQMQYVRYSSNSAALRVPEGVAVPWPDSLCMWALRDGLQVSNQVQTRWAEAIVAHDLGVRTFVSVPIYLSDGSLYGTLCAASQQEALPPEDCMEALELFAQLIGQHIERERMLHQLQQLNQRMADMLLTDPLTQLPNRVAVLKALRHMLARTQRNRGKVWVVMMDLDGFKSINDTYGHGVGDKVLCAVAQRLQQCVRAGDVVGRLSGDEFVMVTPCDVAPTKAQAQALRTRLMQAMCCEVLLESGERLHFGGGSLGLAQVGVGVTAKEALAQADQAMYADKRRRKTLHSLSEPR